MTQARRTLISLAETPYYHCITRCVRRAFLCGNDPVTHRSFDHRKVWLVERFKKLSSIFAIDICAYAVMSNHYHLVLYVDQHRVDTWSDEEVMARWGKLFSTSAETLRHQLTLIQSPAAEEVFRQKLRQWRVNLRDISWFMKCLNEYIARRSNKEDNCKGHFWEARFTSQALLDQQALLTCMTYVDLNPVRAAMASTPEDSDFTSIQERLVAYAKKIDEEQQTARQKQLIKHFHNYYEKQCANPGTRKRCSHPKAELKPFAGTSRVSLSAALPYSEQDYFQLVESTGRVIRKDKRGSIPNDFPGLLSRMGFEEQSWLDSVQRFQDRYGAVAGSLEALRSYEERSNKKGVKGIEIAERLERRMVA